MEFKTFVRNCTGSSIIVQEYGANPRVEERNCIIPVEGTSIVVADELTIEKPRKKSKKYR
jgi:hypothetical protein